MLSSKGSASGLEDVRGWGARRYLLAFLVGVGWLVLSGVPTGIIETPFFSRMTPVEWWNYPFWTVSAALVGLLAATYLSGSRPKNASGTDGRALGGGLLSVFAIGCPVCNKLVVLALGASGALTYFAPVQPILGFLSLVLFFFALRVRLSAERSCPVGRGTAMNIERGVVTEATTTRPGSEVLQDRKGEHRGR